MSPIDLNTRCRHPAQNKRIAGTFKKFPHKTNAYLDGLPTTSLVDPKQWTRLDRIVGAGREQASR
jgi:hypothetical protein